MQRGLLATATTSALRGWRRTVRAFATSSPLALLRLVLRGRTPALGTVFAHLTLYPLFPLVLVLIAAGRTTIEQVVPLEVVRVWSFSLIARIAPQRRQFEGTAKVRRVDDLCTLAF